MAPDPNGGPSVIGLVSSDCEDAAALFRTCRRGGETVRKVTDCFIGAVAIRAGVPVLQGDSDFTVLARHTPLQSADV